MKSNFRNIILFLCFSYTFQNEAHTQLYENNGFGGTTGIHLNLGTHKNRIGFHINLYYFYLYGQINTGYYGSFQISTKEPKGRFFEQQIYLGGKAYFGKDTTERFLINEYSINSSAPWGFGYYYTWYFDTRETSQNSGGLAFHLKGVDIVTENDLFAGQGRDRFRTGGLQLGYTYQNFYFAYYIEMWTGETRGAPRIKPEETEYPSKGGYKDLSETYLGKTSQGISSLRTYYNLGYGQHLRAEVGIDAEQIRHFFQNKLIHDPASVVNKHNPHYPMLRQDGTPAMSKKDNIGKPLFFFQAGGNAPTFY